MTTQVHQLKDGHIFAALDKALDVDTPVAELRRLRDDVLKRLGSKSPAFDLMRVLLMKTSSVRRSACHARFI